MAISREQYEEEVAATRDARMAWWRDARFGLFLHHGVYSVVGRNEWVWDIECIPRKDYEVLTERWQPQPGAPREWARLARDAGMKYIVMTAKHLDGFCLWDSAVTDFNAARLGPKRDIVREYLEACREFDLKAGLYFSVGDWHYPVSCDQGIRDPDAAEAWNAYVRECIRELMTHYGRIDILWYDTGWPVINGPEYSLHINHMARELQPEIIINDRNMLPEDHATPEGHVSAASPGRDWEACMTSHPASWGYMPSALKDLCSPRDVLRMLNTTTCGSGGNLLLNIGPAPDGSLPQAFQDVLRTVGQWISRNSEAVYGRWDAYGQRIGTATARAARRGSTLYLWVYYWPGSELPIGGFETPLQKASFLVGDKPIAFEQTGLRIVLKDLPQADPDEIAGVTVLKLEFAEAPTIAASNAWKLRSE